MRGAYSNPSELLGRLSQHNLFPGNAYRHNSGGDPAVIPTLTREGFVAGGESDVYHALSTADRYMAPLGYRPNSRKDSEIKWQKRSSRHP